MLLTAKPCWHASTGGQLSGADDLASWRTMADVVEHTVRVDIKPRWMGLPTWVAVSVTADDKQVYVPCLQVLEAD